MLPLSALLSEEALATLDPTALARGVFTTLVTTRLMAPSTAMPPVVTDWVDTAAFTSPPILTRLTESEPLLPLAIAAWRRLGEPELADALLALSAAPGGERPALAAAVDARLVALAGLHGRLLRAHLDAFRSVPDLDPSTLPSFLRAPDQRPDVRALLADTASDDGLEDAVWAAVCERVREALPDDETVRDWFLTRLTLWDTLNGGAAQTAVNLGGTLAEAVRGWRRAGHADVAELYAALDDARAALPAEATYDDLVAAVSHLDEPLFALLQRHEALHVRWIRREQAAFELFLRA